MLARSRPWWELRILFEAPGGGGEAGPKRFVVLENAGRPEGYAIYRHKPKFDGGEFDSELQVVEAVVPVDERRERQVHYRIIAECPASAPTCRLPAACRSPA